MFKFCSPKQAQSFQLGKVIALLMVTTYFFPIISFANRQFEGSKSFKRANTNSELKGVEFQPTLPMGNIKNISSPFGTRLDPFTGFLEHHQGVDYPAANGTPILATASGTITQAGYKGGYGNLVEIEHGQGYTSKYGHASQILVHVGQQVQKGQIIALVGSTGHSTGPHLHFEMAQDGQAFNPLAFMAEGLQLGSGYSSALHLVKGTTYMNNYPLNSKNTKSFITTGDMIVAVRVRSGKAVKW